MPSLPADDLRDLLAAFVRRVIIRQDRIEVRLGKKELRRLLENGNKVITDNLSSVRKPVDLNDLITLTIEAKRKRFGGEVHMVVPPNASILVGQPKPALIKAIARAHGWYERVIQGKSLDMRSLARQTGLTERYVGNVFGCALLAPDIVEAILDGRQPQDLNFEKLCQRIPLSWLDQRTQLGFPQTAFRSPGKPFLK